MQSFILVKSFLLIKGNNSLKYIHLHVWYHLNDQLLLMSTCLFVCFICLLGIVKSKNVSDRHTKSKLLLLTKASTNVALIKSWAAKPFKFQWENLMLDDHFGSELVSISLDNKSRRCLKLFIKYPIVNIWSGQVKFVSIILSDATNKNKITSIKNGFLNDFLNGLVGKHLIWMFGSVLKDCILRL